MIQAKFSVLGIENSGKTTYISKIKKFNLNSNVFSITESSNNSYDTAKTPIGYYYSNQFALNYKNECLVNFQINDYFGELLKLKETQQESFTKLENDLYSSDFIMIFIDGNFFCDDDKNVILKNLKRKCARIINPYISNYSGKNNGFIPPILIAVTKSVSFAGKYSTQDIFDLVNESFNGIFSDETQQYVICIDNNAKTAVEIPILIGLDYVLSRECQKIKADTERQNAVLTDTISDRQKFVDEQESRLILKSRSKINDAKDEINQLNEKIQTNINSLNNNIIWNQRDVLRSVIAEKLEINRNSLVYGFDKELTYQKMVNESDGGIGWLIVLAVIAIVLVILFIANSTFRTIAIYAVIGIALLLSSKKIIDNKKNK